MPVAISADERMGPGGSAKPRSSLKARVLTAVVLVPLLLAAMLFLPNPAFALVTLVPAALGAHEWARLCRFSPAWRYISIAGLVLAGLLLVAAQWCAPDAAATAASWLYLAALLFWSIAAPAWLYFKWPARGRAAMLLTGWLVLLPSWLAFASLQKSPVLLLMILLVVWIADTAAYFAGRRFGRRKLAPAISPGKTWEGVIGAAVAVLAYGVAVGFALQPGASAYDRIGFLVFIAVLTAFGIIGDLFESWVKRQAGAKDSGALLPGHGGVLDRIDSLTAAMPFAALYFSLYAS
jgi:phosphatidate cytidylyltransferase